MGTASAARCTFFNKSSSLLGLDLIIKRREEGFWGQRGSIYEFFCLIPSSRCTPQTYPPLLAPGMLSNLSCERRDDSKNVTGAKEGLPTSRLRASRASGSSADTYLNLPCCFFCSRPCWRGARRGGAGSEAGEVRDLAGSFCRLAWLPRISRQNLMEM